MAEVRTRTQSERREATIGALLDAARESFANDGYAATSLDAVVAAAGVSKGALYHHFAGKKELFQAVYEREQDGLAEICAQAAAAVPDPWDALEAGAGAFLAAVLDPEVQRIVLLDSFGALGHATVRAGEATSMALLTEGLRQSIAVGRLPDRPVEPLAAMLFGALCEASLTIAAAEDQAAAHDAAIAELHTWFAALAA